MKQWVLTHKLTWLELNKMEREDWLSTMRILWTEYYIVKKITLAALTLPLWSGISAFLCWIKWAWSDMYTWRECGVLMTSYHLICTSLYYLGNGAFPVSLRFPIVWSLHPNSVPQQKGSGPSAVAAIFFLSGVCISASVHKKTKQNKKQWVWHMGAMQKDVLRSGGGGVIGDAFAKENVHRSALHLLFWLPVQWT